VILGLLLRSDELLLAIRSGDDRWEFRRCDVNWTESTDDAARGYIWDRLDNDLRRVYQEADTLAVALPASECMVKRVEIAGKPEDEIPGYRKWRAGIELPGDSDLFAHGYLPSTEDPGRGKSEMAFFAAPADYVQRLTRTLIRENDTRVIQFVPEQIGLAWLALKSATDYNQLALAHFDLDYAVVIIIRDGRFCKARYFRSGDGNNEEVAVDIETFLLSVAGHDESLPLIVTGSVDRLMIDWSPGVPAFLDEREMEFSSVWGVTEFITRGGRCELRAGS
jgi:hypothetical protein